MLHRIALSLVLLGVSACGRDKNPEPPPTTGDTGVTLDTLAEAPSATPATTQGGAATPAGGVGGATPAGGARGTAGGARGTAAAPRGASAELAGIDVVYTVQVAAFLNASSAEALRARLERQGVPVWTTTTTVHGQRFTRVRVGASTTPAGARAVAARIQRTYGWPIWLTTVSDRAALPDDALGATRAYAAR